MVDVHSHILWNVDDGPNTLDETIQIIRHAVNEGITDIVATPHFHHPLFSVTIEAVKEKVDLLQNELRNRNISLVLHTGHEVRVSDQMIKMIQLKRIHTIANSNYLLIELPSHTIPHYTKYLIQQLLEEGIFPIIAHPERNKAIIENPNRLEKLIRLGALAQITAGSLVGAFGREVQKLSLDIVCANLVHTYGSDVHNVATRPFIFNTGLAYLEKQKQLHIVDILLENNTRVIENKPLILLEPAEVKVRKWWQFI